MIWQSSKNDVRVSVSAMNHLEASNETFFPRFKGDMPWSRTLAMRMSQKHKPRHTVPLVGTLPDTQAPVCLLWAMAV